MQLTAGFMTHVTCRLTAITGISFGTLRSAVECGLALPYYLYKSSVDIDRERERKQVVTVEVLERGAMTWR